MPAAISRSTNSSEGYPTSLPSSRNIDTRDSGSGSGKEIGKERTVPCRMFQFFFFNPFTRSLHLLIVDFRILEERRESPIFETDRPTAPGKFEATPKFTTPRSLLVVSVTILKPTGISGISSNTHSSHQRMILPCEAMILDLDFAKRKVCSFLCLSMSVLPTRLSSPLTAGSREVKETPRFQD